MRDDWTPPATGFVDAGNGETILGLLRKGAPHPKIQYSAQVCFNEAASAMQGLNVIKSIRGFAYTARAIIAAFDTP